MADAQTMKCHCLCRADGIDPGLVRSIVNTAVCF